MTELANTNAAPATRDAPTARTSTTIDASKGTTFAGGRSIRALRWLLVVNLALVALQPISAGFLLSGYTRAAAAHAIGAQALALGTLIQALVAAVLWRQHRLPARVAAASIGLFAIVFLQVAFGYRKLFWLHVPIGVAIPAIVAALQRQVSRLETLRRTTGAPS